MSKQLVQIFENGKNLCTKKLSLKDNLSEVRKKIKFENKKNTFFLNGDSPIDIEDENDILVEEILNNKNIYLKIETIKLFINDKFIIDVDLDNKESLKKLIDKYSKNIPSKFSFIDKENRNIKKEDAINDEEILINDILIDNNIKIITENKNNDKKNFENHINEEPIHQKVKTISVQIFLNGKACCVKKLNEEIKLLELRKILSDIMSDNCYFTNGTAKIPDEEDFLLKEIIKENAIYIRNDYSSLEPKDSEHEENLLNNINDSNSSDKKDNVKVMTIIENGKKIKVKKINVNEPLNELRNKLELPENVSFLNEGTNIDIKDESDFNIIDIFKDDLIYIKREESKLYTIYFNNQVLTRQNLEPSKDLESLRNLLSIQINEDAYFINANTKEKINKNDEKYNLLSKMSNNENEIFIEQKIETKNEESEVIKGSEFLDQKGKLKIYKYNCVTQNEVENMIKQKKIKSFEEYEGQIFDFNDEAESKTIIVLGQTGSGKTTLLNSLANYILGVKFEDDFRYVIIDEKNVQGLEDIDQTKSVTQNTSIYYIKKYKDFPSIILIDTPGFGDTSGPEKDKDIIKDIKNTFENKLTKIDAICFVVQSSNVRLTANQNYIFSSVMSLFGKDIAENFVPMLTFCDANEPQIIKSLVAPDSIFNPILKAIQKYDPWYLQFNNSAIFTSSFSQFNKMFWDLAMASFKVFIEKLKNLPSKSLESSKEVLRTRKIIEDDILDFKKKLDEGLEIMREIENTRMIVEKNKKKIMDSKNFTYKVNVKKFKEVKLPSGIHTTNCMNCNNTCHKNCSYADDSKKKNCCAMDKNGKCKRCEKKCDWTCHKNLPYIFEYYTVEETKTYENLKKEFLDSKSKVPEYQQVLTGLERKYDDKFIDCFEICEKLNKSVNELKRVALNANSNQKTEEYITLLISNEEKNPSEGWVNRKNRLEEIRDIHRLTANLISGEDLMEQLKDYRKKTLEERTKLRESLKNKDSMCLIF